MSSVVLTFRHVPGHVPNEVEGAAWMAWFGELGSSTVDMGSQVGATSSLGSAPTGGVVTGYASGCTSSAATVRLPLERHGDERRAVVR